MERTHFIEHAGKRILVFDYTGIRDPGEALATIEESKRIVRTQPERSLLILTNVKDARYNAAVMQGMKELAAHNTPYVRASALVGMSGLHRIVYQAVVMFSKRKIQVFDDVDAAKDWLVQQE